MHIVYVNHKIFTITQTFPSLEKVHATSQTTTIPAMVHLNPFTLIIPSPPLDISTLKFKLLTLI